MAEALASAFGRRRRGPVVISDHGDGVREVVDFAPSDSIVIHACGGNGATVRLTGEKAAKAVVEACADLRLEVETTFISGQGPV